MFLKTAIDTLQDSVPRDCGAFLPELVLCTGIVVLLLLRLFSAFDRWHLGWLALGFTGIALAAAYDQWFGGIDWIPTPEQFRAEAGSADLFSRMLVYDYFTVFLRLFLLTFALLIIWLSLLTGIPDREDSADFYTLILGATVGMSVMASTNHLLMMFIGIEMASLPSYALAGYLKGRRQSSEAALKYVVYGGGAAGVMLYGISLLAGRFGTAYLPELGAAYVASVGQGAAGFDPILLLGTLFVMIGIGFKLAAVPFHFWCPDVFEGASAEVAGFLSVASKGAALALLARVALALGGIRTLTTGAPPVMNPMVHYLVPTLAVFAILTATFGNLAAFYQNNLKRLLAYSTIAHAGYMMMGLATLRGEGVRAVLFYLIAYLLMNLGAFAIVAFLRNQTGSEDLADYRGLVRRSPWMVITLCIFLLSLLGVPPLAGFVAKFQIFAALLKGAQDYATAAPTLSTWLIVTLVLGGINSVVSAVYYVKVMKTMILDERVEDVEGKEPVRLREPVPSVAFAVVLAGAVAVFLAFWSPLQKAGDQVAPLVKQSDRIAKGSQP
ncbi:MAG: NADH-quinone oxidoreductase subunit N [Planctomycetes bacterium]|nr:NADH-quinone oxidoreductase subunit N [Planctomycetota bacterium]